MLRATRRLRQTPVIHLAILAPVATTFALAIILAPSQAEADNLLLDTVTTPAQQITALAHAGDSRLFLASKEGRIYIFDGTRVLASPFLDIRSRVRSTNAFDDERGLLSLAFHPNYVANGFVYVTYTNSDSNSRISRFQVSSQDPNRANAGSELVILDIAQLSPNHNVDHLVFGPDGYLYISAGDGGYLQEPRCTGQQKSSLLGKLLRIDVDRTAGSRPYAIPADNPFVGEPSSRGEIWAMGLRNPWRFSFDRQTGDLYLGDVGHGTREEINFQSASSRGGQNYGFKMLEGRFCRGSSAGCGFTLPSCDHSGYTAPILEYGHDSRHCAVVSGFVYRGGQIPELEGRYVYGDFCGAMALAFNNGTGWQSMPLQPDIPALTTFGEDALGELYIGAASTLYQVVGFGEAGTFTFAEMETSALENSAAATVRVTRSGGSDGAVMVDYALSPGTATAGLDYLDVAGTLSWADGESGEKTFTVPLLDDGALEGDETVGLELSSPTGGAGLGSQASAQLRIIDDDIPAGSCIPDDVTLCLQDGRFQVRIDWRSPQGESGLGRAASFTDATGYFWFFDPTNVEVVVKLLDACDDPFNRFWVFASGLTNVEVDMSIFDTEARVLKTYRNPLGTPFQPIQDTQAFETCP